MKTSAYQNLKLHIVDIVSLSKDAIHVHIGLVIFFAAVVIWKKGKITLTCLIPVLLLAAGMELIDLYDDFNSVGYMRWSDSIHDFANTSIWPILIVVLVTLKNAKIKNL